MSQNILSLSSEEALDFLLKSEQYHSFELPEYFTFDEVLSFVRETIGTKSYDECLGALSPDHLDSVNFEMLLNKDGRYAVRPLTLANPYLYYFLVREICCPSHWEAIQRCFQAYTVPHITSCALPIVPDPKRKEAFHKSSTILNWWNTMEQRSVELSLEYRYMFISDITNCYGSINPQCIAWALACSGTRYETEENTSLATNIQRYLHALQQGRNIGLPQGSAVFDIIAELVLGYSDLLLYDAMQHEGLDGYEIIRYRDDYHVFCNDRDTLERISYILQGVLERLNFRMNSQKTKISESIITDSIKADKLGYIYNTPIYNKKGNDFDSFEKHLLYILLFSRHYPNSGQLKVMLSDIDKRIAAWVKPFEVKSLLSILADGQSSEEEKTFWHKKLTGGTVRAMVAIATQIAMENVSASHYALRVASRMIDSLDDITERQDIISKVYHKLCRQPNSDYNKLWLQNMTYSQDVSNGVSPYDTRLCRLVMGEQVQLWDNSWLKEELTISFPQSSVVHADTLAKVTPIITFRETRAYTEGYDEAPEPPDFPDIPEGLIEDASY